MSPGNTPNLGYVLDRLPLRFALSPGQACDSTLAGALLDDRLLPDSVVLAAKAQSAEWIGAMIEAQDAESDRQAPSERRGRVTGAKPDAPWAFRKACKPFTLTDNLLADGEGLRETEGTEQTGPEPKEATSQSGPGATRSDSPPPTQDKTNAVDAGQRQPPCKAVPLIVAAMRAHDDDWDPLSAIGGHVRAANSEFDPRTYGSATFGGPAGENWPIPGRAERSSPSGRA